MQKIILSAIAILSTFPVLAASRVATNSVPPPPVNWTAGVSYTYDGSGDVRRIGDDTFVYDNTSRLVQATVNGSQRDYEYDAFGNRRKCTISGGGDCQYGVQILPSNNRIDGAGYDGAGNVHTFDGHVYSYDPANMTTRDERPATHVAKEFIYTADDERIAVYSVGDSWRWTVRDVSGKVLREFTSTDGPQGRGMSGWAWSRDDIWRDGQLLASRQPVSGAIATYHYHLDHLGTPRRVTDQIDTIVGSHDYYAFGPEVSGGMTEGAAATFKYTGHERDVWSNDADLDTLDYMHARYYNPALGRFLQIDPSIEMDKTIREPQRWNRYAYVTNNPMRFTDPNGRERIPCAAFPQTGHCAPVPWRGFVTETSEQLMIASMLGMPMPGEGLLGRFFGVVGRFFGAVAEEGALSRAVILALRSTEAATRLEGEAAVAVSENLVGFRKAVFEGTRKVGEIDVETTRAIVEVTGGQSPGKVNQITKLITNKTINPQGKPVVVYGPKLGEQAVKALEKAGAKVVKTLEELREVAGPTVAGTP